MAETSFLSGKLDCNAVRQAFASISSETGHIILDMSDAEDISCNGIRALLEQKNSGIDFEIVNMPGALYHMFEVSGVSKLIPPGAKPGEADHKGPEIIPTKDLTEIARGRSAVVYAYGEDKILKAFLPVIPEKFVTDERDMTRKVFESGIETAMAFDVVKTEDGYGAIFEKLNGSTLLDAMFDDKAHIEEYARNFGEFVRKSHQIKMDPQKFSNAKDRLLSYLEDHKALGITKRTQRKLMELVNLLPYSDTFLHGDCQTANVMLHNGELIYIDLGRTSRGASILDFVGMFLHYDMQNHLRWKRSKGGVNYRNFTDEENNLIWNSFLKAASGLTDEEELKKLDQQVFILTCLLMLLTRVSVSKKFLPGIVYKILTRELVKYCNKGPEPFMDLA